MRLSLKNFGPLDTANIDIGKITVIGGENATGKSTTSKILYCFLRANSSKRQEITYDYLVNRIKSETRDIQRHLKDHARINIDLNEYSKRLTQYATQRRLNQNKTGLEIISEIYDEIKEKVYNQKITSDSTEYIEEKFEGIDNFIYMVEENDHALYVYIMKKLIKEEFSTTDFNGIFEISGVYMNKEYDFRINFDDNDLNSDEVFSSEGWFTLNDIYYIDSFSILDLDQNLGLNDSEHARFLTTNLKKDANDTDDYMDAYKRIGQGDAEEIIKNEPSPQIDDLNI